MRGNILLPVLVGVAIFVGVVALIGGQKQNTEQTPQNVPHSNSPSQNKAGTQESSYQGYGFKKAFYEEDGVAFQHYFPGEGSFSAEETEVLIINGSKSAVQIKTFEINYAVSGKSYSHKSGTWEKFPTRESWDKIEYLNISPQYYQGQPLVLARGEKGKLHWHLNFGPQPLDGKQLVKVKLTLLKGSETITIDKEFTRASGPVFSKDSH